MSEVCQRVPDHCTDLNLQNPDEGGRCHHKTSLKTNQNSKKSSKTKSRKFEALNRFHHHDTRKHDCFHSPRSNLKSTYEIAFICLSFPHANRRNLSGAIFQSQHDSLLHISRASRANSPKPKLRSVENESFISRIISNTSS